MMSDRTRGALIIAAAVAVIASIPILAWGLPKYKGYLQSCRVEANLKEAEINRQILVEQARAEEEALLLEANGQAERDSIKAQTTADAISLVGDALQSRPEYLNFHWINEVAGSTGERIYIPTENGIPSRLYGGVNSKPSGD